MNAKGSDSRADPSARVGSAVHDSAEVSRAYLRALERRDFEAVSRLLAPDAWLRALLPRELIESRTDADTVEILRSWFAAAREFRVLWTDHRSSAGRERIAYGFLLKPDWAPEQWHVIEQVGFCRIRDGRISRIDVSCTGFVPTSIESARGLAEERPAGLAMDASPGPASEPGRRDLSRGSGSEPARSRSPRSDAPRG